LFVDGRAAGIMNVVSARPLEHSERLEAVFRIFAARAQAELARLQRERDILALNESLDQRVRERTAEVEQANRELEAFSYSVSHDLRAPLRGIDGFAQLIEERHAAALPEEGRQFLKRVRTGTQRMGRIIDDLLQLARVGRGELAPTVVDLSQLARAIAAELSRSQPERRVHWVIEPGLSARADAGLAHIALSNLLGNAFKYTGKVAETRIAFEHVHGADTAPGWVDLSVTDNGAGFDMAYAAQLFQPFRRLHGQHEFEGSGIGLATVRRIVERHGGSVRGEGAPGAGACFTIRLPAAARQEDRR
ncbi:MAG: ATP-binding protein, partial [Rubrivivax sp.]